MALDKKTIDARKKFAEYFSKEHNCTVTETKIAELRCNTLVYKKLNLKKSDYLPSLWGLIVFTDKGLWFYYQEQETYIEKLSLRGTRKLQQQSVCLTELKTKFSLPQKKWWWFLFPEKKRTVYALFYDENSGSYFFKLIFNCNALEVFDRLK